MSAVYIYAAIAKMNYDWLFLAIPLTHWLPKRIGKFEDTSVSPFLSHLFDTAMDSKLVAQFMSVTGMLYDLLIPVLFSLGGFWRIIGFGLTCVFHITNKIIFSIGIFPYLSLALATVYFEFDWPLRVWNGTVGRILYGWLGFGRADETTADHEGTKQQHPRVADTTTAPFVSTYKTKLMTIVLVMVAGHQILYPLRHYLYPGDVTWNELGHRYSWRMKLRDKVGMVKCGRELPDGHIEEVPSGSFLTKKQERTIAGRPEMVEEYAHYLSEYFTYLAGDGKHCPIYCLSLASVNFRMPQFLLDPRVDLASTPLWSTTAEFYVEFLPRDVTKDHPFVPPIDFDETRVDRKRVRELFRHFSIDDARNHFRELEKLGIIDKPMQKGGVKVLDQNAALRWRQAKAESISSSSVHEEL
jgi:vitamin K-dependent gamma-carboxylase